MAKGRDFTPQDTKSSQRAVIVSEAFVNRYWPGQEAIGKQLNSDLTHEWFTVVGVARDTKTNSLNEKPLPFVYLPLYQVYRADMTICARVAGDPLTFSQTLEKTIHELNADVGLFDITTLELRNQFASFGQHIAGTFVGAFGLLALVLAAVGIYGVTAYTTRQRTHEIGIRVTLGATKKDVFRLVLGHGVRVDAHRRRCGIGAVVRADALSEWFAAGRDEHRCADVFERGVPALRRGVVRLLHTGAPRHARGPDGGAAPRIVGARRLRALQRGRLAFRTRWDCLHAPLFP